MKPFFVFVLLFVFVLCSVHAATLTDTVINLTDSNTTVNVSNTWTYDTLRIDDTSLTISNLSQDTGVGSQAVSLNFSRQHARFNGSHFPYFMDQEYKIKRIVYGLVEPVNGTLKVLVSNCSGIVSLSWISADGNYNSIPTVQSCEGQWAILNPVILEDGINTLTMDFVDVPTEEVKDSTTKALSKFLINFGLIGVVLIFAFIMGILGKFILGGSTSMDINTLKVLIMTLVVGAIILVIGIVVLSGVGL